MLKISESGPKKLRTRKLEHMQNYNNHKQKQQIDTLAK